MSTVSIIPGIEARPPESTETSSAVDRADSLPPIAEPVDTPSPRVRHGRRPKTAAAVLKATADLLHTTSLADLTAAQLAAASGTSRMTAAPAPTWCIR